MKRDRWMVWIICIGLIMFAGIFYLYSGSVSREETSSFTNPKQEISDRGTRGDSAQRKAATAKPDECVVYVCGAVHHPGVYRLSGTSRVCDAIEAAGGLLKSASYTSVNQARFLVDGEQITIPVKQEEKKSALRGKTKKSDKENTASENTEERININQASADELMTLPGIGAAKAEMILEYRTQNGSFGKTEDIMKISGIKEGVYRQIKDKITV